MKEAEFTYPSASSSQWVWPKITSLAPVTARLDNETAARLNARVDVDGEEPTQVAWDWLREEGLITD